MVGRDVYFWAWPMVNMYNKRLAFSHAPEPGLLGGILPFAPLNRLAMLTDYVEPSERYVACPNQDVVYGFGITALDQSPVVVQVPDFGERFWAYQVGDLRTDGFADIGAVYGTKPGFYLLVGPNWDADIPEGIAGVFAATTSTGCVGPRIFQDDTPEDRAKVQSAIQAIDMYPLSMFDGTMKRRDWLEAPTFPNPADAQGEAETQWVFPETFLDQLPDVLADAPARPGEEARYAQVTSLLRAAEEDISLKEAIIEAATDAEAEVILPLLEFRHFGVSLPHHWTTINNGAAFGSDYFTRTAVAKSNILVNKANETKYFYQDLDTTGARLNGDHCYTVTFNDGQLPPVRGFWSLTLYNEHHFFAPNEINRYSVGTKNKDLQPKPDGSLTIQVQSGPPSDLAQRANWLPSPSGANFSLFLRAYWPEEPVTSGRWTPPAVCMSS
jgi:hypothetical protein